jgi:hypothetical protein
MSSGDVVVGLKLLKQQQKHLKIAVAVFSIPYLSPTEDTTRPWKPPGWRQVHCINSYKGNNITSHVRQRQLRHLPY